MLELWLGYCEFCGCLVIVQLAVIVWLAWQLSDLDKMSDERSK